MIWIQKLSWQFDATARSLLQFFDKDVTEGDVAVIALEKNRARLVDFVIEFAASSFGAFNVVVNFYAVEGERDFVSDDGGFSGLPLVTGFGDEFVGCFEVVDGAIAVDGVSAASIITEDLNFMAATKIEAAVGFIGHHEFKFDGEIPKFVVGDEIVAVKVFVRSVLQDAVFDGPTVATSWMTEMPASRVLSVEERTKASFIGGESAEG